MVATPKAAGGQKSKPQKHTKVDLKQQKRKRETDDLASLETAIAELVG